MQNTIQKFGQGSIVFEKPGIPSENLKTLTSSNYCSIVFAELLLDLDLFANIKKNLVSTQLFFTLFLITQDLNKIKKIPHTLL